MRVFFALQPGQDLCMELADWRARALAGSGRPVPPANFHITLAFLGEVAPSSLEHLCQKVDNFCERHQPTGGHVQLDQLGYWHRPGIFWLGPRHWPSQLQELADKLRGIASASGGKRERKPLQPHITLFRGCSDAPAAPQCLPELGFDYRDFALFESCQGRRGVSYRPVQYWSLADPA